MVSLSAAEDEELIVLEKAVQEAILPIVTSEWLEVTSDLLINLETLVRNLEPGVLVGDAYPNLKKAHLFNIGCHRSTCFFKPIFS